MSKKRAKQKEDALELPPYEPQDGVAQAPTLPSNVVQIGAAIPKRERKISVTEFVRGKGPIHEAFATVEGMQAPRKLSASKWAEEFEQFVKTPRGGR